MTLPPSRFNGSVGSEGTLRVASGNAVHSSSRPSASDRGAAGLESPMLVDEAVTRGADALGMAGGDGSLAVVAAAARAHPLPFVCVPAGTRNHFALDLGVDRDDLVGSLDAFAEGVERVIDVAEVNGRLFLNNVSLGIYGDAVQQPSGLQLSASGSPPGTRFEPENAEARRPRGQRAPVSCECASADVQLLL